MISRTLHRHSRATFSNEIPVSPISARRLVEIWLLLLDDEAGTKACVEATRAADRRAWIFMVMLNDDDACVCLCFD